MRSAYHIEWQHQYNGQTGHDLVQGTALDNPIYKNLWKLAVPCMEFYRHIILSEKILLACPSWNPNPQIDSG